jgi:hypothetical protein
MEVSMTKMFLAAVVSLFMSLFMPLGALAQPLEGDDRSAVEAVIEGQLRAFKHDNAAEAYGFAAPMIQQIFPSPETFIGMVKRGYQPVYRNKSYQFSESYLDQLGRPTQHVIITADDGKRYEATYTMELQPDGKWKIAGCILKVVPDAGA